MKQRIRTVAIIRSGDKVLVLKRIRDRTETPVFWELPTGKIRFGEQPEEAVTRMLEEYVGISVSKIQLKDVITFVSLEGASRLENLYIIYEITSHTENLKPKIRYSAYKYINESNSSSVHLNGASSSVLEIENGRIINDRTLHQGAIKTHIINVDGASRGNPGPSGIGYLIRNNAGKIIEQGGEFVGFTTARSAEYFAMKKGIERASELGIKSAQFISDSLMMINQLKGIIKPKNQDIIPIYQDIQQLLSSFESISFTHVPREENEVADKEANKAIDQILS